MVGQPNRIFGGGQEVMDAMGFPEGEPSANVSLGKWMVIRVVRASGKGHLLGLQGLQDAMWLRRSCDEKKRRSGGSGG